MDSTTKTLDARADASARGRVLAELADPLRLTCRDLAHHDDVIRRAGIPADAFRFHTPSALDPDDEADRCFCYEEIADPSGWDAENRREANGRCGAPVTIARPGFELAVCCRCFDRAGADKLAEAARLVARTIRNVEAARRPMERVADRTRAELIASRVLIRAGHDPALVAKAGRVLRGEAS